MKKVEYESKNGKLALVNEGYNNKVFIIGTHEMLCEFTDIFINAKMWVEKQSKCFE